MNEPLNVVRNASDPLLGWAGLDPAGRVTALGGAIAAGSLLSIGEPLAAALRDAGAVESFLASVRAAAGAAGGGRAGGLEGGTAAGPALVDAQRLRVHFGAPTDRPTMRTTLTVDLVLRARRARSGVLRIAAEFWQSRVAGTDAGTAAGAEAAHVQPMLAPVPIGPERAVAADLWLLGTALYAATVAPSATRPTGLIRLLLHPVALPRIRAIHDPDPWIEVALARLAATAGALAAEAVVARTGTRELTVWVRDGADCRPLCEQWLAAMTATPLIGRERRLVVAPAAAWCVVPADGTVLGHLLDALDVVHAPAEARAQRPALQAGSLARERDIDERREPLTGTLVELAQSGRARLAAEPIVDAPTGLVCGWRLGAEFRSLFAVAQLLDYLPDIVEDEAAADALNEWMAAAIRAAAAPGGTDALDSLQLRIAPAQLSRLDSLSGVVEALRALGSTQAPCLLLPEAAVHRNAYLVIDAAAEVAGLGATLGVDDYRGLLPPSQLAQAGLRALRLHRSLVRDLTEHRFALDRLADLLARARGSGLSVVVSALASPLQLLAANAAGALEVAGPVFGRAQRIDSSTRFPWQVPLADGGGERPSPLR